MEQKVTSALMRSEEEDEPHSSHKRNLGIRKVAVAEQASQPFYPYFFKNNLNTALQQHYSKNGHLKLLKSLQVEIVSDIERCHELWSQFSPYKTLFDTWDFRYAFWLGYHHQPYFIVLKNDSENLAVLPLWYEDDQKKYFWFGSWWQEESSLFVKNPLLVPPLLALCPSPVLLNAINLETALWAKDFVDFEADDPKYVENISQMHSVDDFLAEFRKKKRQNLRRDRKAIEAQHPVVTFDNFSDFDHLVRLCQERFAQKGEEADWKDPRRVGTFRQVINLGRTGKEYRIRMISIRIGDKVAGVDLIAIYDGCYSPIKCGYDVKNFPGIGNYVNLLEIEDAIRLGMKKVDFLEISYGWKDKYFDAVPLFKYERGEALEH